MMSWFNYKAPALNAPLNSSIIINSEKLISTIENISANSTLYHCYYDLEKRDNYANYEGLLKPVFDTIHLDFDSKDDEGTQAWNDTKTFCLKLLEAECNFQLYFSGNKGFHIAIHKSAFNITEGTKELIEATVKNVCYSLKQTYPTLDTGIWNANRKFRAYRSQHEKSKLYKIRLTDAGIKPSTLSIGEIRNLATRQQAFPYAHPLKSKPVPFLINATPPQPTVTSGKSSKVYEMTANKTIEDASLKFKNFKDKKCINSMFSDDVLPQFNRHQIELALMYDYRMQGMTLEATLKKMNTWASRIYASEPERIKDCERQVRECFTKSIEDDKLYQFGCFGDLKKAYCSAKCKIYNSLDPKLRAEPLDVTRSQSEANQVRSNPNLELSEGELADLLLQNFGKEIIKCDDDFFFWETTHWNRLDKNRAHAALYTLASAAYENQAPFAKIESLVKQIKIKIPVAPESNHFYTSSTQLFNFTDGTVEVSKDPEGKIVMYLRKHDKKDMLGYCNQYPFSGADSLPRSGHLKHYFDSRLVDLGPEGVRMMKQMLGAAMIPYKPWIFFLVGDSDSGKSTMALMIKALLGERNVSGVEPIKTNNSFQWESAIGKIANIATELPRDEPLDVNTLKKVRDKTPQFINRKGVKAIEATLPFLHIYCANILPSSFEGNTGALDNRMSIIKFKKVYVNGLAGIENLGQWLWAHDAGSIVDMAREGLADLVESGFSYFRNQEAIDSIKNWQKITDPIKQFVDDVEAGDLKLAANVVRVNDQSLIKGQDIFAIYKDWSSRCGYKNVGLAKFYTELERCGVGRVKRVSEGRFLFWEKAQVISANEASC